MSRLGCRRSLTIAVAVAAGLVAPAAAGAATYSIRPGDGACGGADLACGGFAEAAAAAAPGDIFNVTPAVYPGANFTASDITINGSPGVLVNGTLQFSAASGGVSIVSGVSVAQTAASAPGVLVTGGHDGLQLSDAAVVSKYDDGIVIATGTANRIVRTIAVTGGTQQSAIYVESNAGTPAKSLTVDSSLTSGGLAGIGAKTRSTLLEAGAGPITLNLRHVTAAGSANGIRLDSAQAQGLLTSVGSITANVTDSITLANAEIPYNGAAGTGIGANTATINATRTLLSGDRDVLFGDAAGGNFRLRPGSPAIGQGGIEPGESPTDIDGEDRSTAPTDLGGDEYSNAPPVAKIVVKTAPPRATQPVAFDASGSSDREAAYGGGIVEYRWSFSDGQAQTTTGPTVSHVFPKEGDAAATLVVVDRQGAASTPAAVALKLVDGTAPTVGIVKPKNGQKIKVFTRRTRTVKGRKRTTRTRAKIVFGGLSRDANGVAQIVLTLEKLRSGAGKSSRCSWYDPKRGFVSRSCTKPVLFSARLLKDSATGQWTYTVKRNLGRGSYRLRAAGVDKTGAVGNAGGSKVGVVRFTLV
jgi:PKD domain-containing protein